MAPFLAKNLGSVVESAALAKDGRIRYTLGPGSWQPSGDPREFRHSPVESPEKRGYLPLCTYSGGSVLRRHPLLGIGRL